MKEDIKDKFVFLSAINLLIGGLLSNNIDLEDIVEWMKEIREDYLEEIKSNLK